MVELIKNFANQPTFKVYVSSRPWYQFLHTSGLTIDLRNHNCISKKTKSLPGNIHLKTVKNPDLGLMESDKITSYVR